MLEKIVKSIQDLEALSALYLENAISSDELNKCKTHVMESLKVNQSRISIAEIVEPLQSLRRLYLGDILSADEYNTARDLLLSHARTASGNLDAYTEVFELYKQGLISVGDLHKTKMKLIKQSDNVRMTDSNKINKLRGSSVPDIPKKAVLYNRHFTESSNPYWYDEDGTSNRTTFSFLQLNGAVFTERQIGQYTSTSEVIRKLILSSSYNISEILVLMLGLTDAELEIAITEMKNPLDSDSTKVLNIFKTLIPIFKP